MPFSDTHCHIDFAAFDGVRNELLVRCEQAGIELIVVPGTVREGWRKILLLCSQFKSLRPALGLHPYFVNEHHEVDLEVLDQQLMDDSSSVVAVGEIGLDAHVNDMPRQQYFFESQLSLAEKHKLPVIIHSRKMHSQLVGVLKRYAITGGVVHAFSGSRQEMEQFVALGLKIGVGSVITWPRSTKTRAAIQSAPLESLVLETDSPDMPIVGQGKGQSTPLNVIPIFESLCMLRSESPEELGVALWNNSLSLYRC